MFDRHNGFKIAVHVSSASGPYILVPNSQLDELDRLLDANGIDHAVKHRLSERDAWTHHQVVHISGISDLQQVQDVLDSMQ